MTKSVGFIGLLIFIIHSFSSGQNFKNRTVLGEKNAKQAIKEAIKDKAKPFYDTLIKNKETAIAIAEPILFDIYGKKDIINERPYECYLIDGYWYISGTLPKDWLGGVFEIIINAKDGKIIKLTHGK
jgi:NTF2 fold immunity protein